MSSWWWRLHKRVDLARNVHTLDDLLLLCRIVTIALCVPALCRLPLGKLEQVLEPSRSGLPKTPAEIKRIVRYVDAVLKAGRPFIQPRCLQRGIILYYFLRRAGLFVTLEFGLRREGSRWLGHCWLIWNGAPCLESENPRDSYTVTYSMPSCGAGSPAVAPGG